MGEPYPKDPRCYTAEFQVDCSRWNAGQNCSQLQRGRQGDLMRDQKV